MRSGLQTYARHFPINRGKERLVSLLGKRLAPREGRLQTRLLKSNIRFTCDLNQFIQRHLYFFGAYERQACAIWTEYARNATLIFDVGANLGVYSLLAANANPCARIHAFEPTPEIFRIFRQNPELNNFRNIEINPVAVGKSNGTAVLHQCSGVDGTNEGMNFISKPSEVAVGSEMAVPVISLKTYCEEHDIEQIDLMKIDIEGGEYEALIGIESLIRRQAIKCIFLELCEWAANRSGHSTKDIKRFLADAGYRLYEVRYGKLLPLAIEGTNNISSAVAFSDNQALTNDELVINTA
jgi:FkbM family methyltransferase